MTSRSKFLHLRHASLLAVLFLTLTLAVRSESTPPAAGPVVMPASAPDSAQVAPDVTDQKPDDNSVVLPPIKPIAIQAERDADIGREVGGLLEQIHYLQQPITPEMSQRWLKNYFQALDQTHLFFLQSDIDEFTAKYDNNLGDILLHSDTDEAAVAPAFEIFNR